MKKIFLLFLLMSISLGYSQDYCGTPVNSANGLYTLNYTCQHIGGTTYELKLEFANTTNGSITGNMWTETSSGNIFLTGSQPVWTNDNKTATYTITSATTPNVYVATIFTVISGFGEVRWDLPTNENFANVCDGGGVEEDTEAPTNFTATIGAITSRSVELLLNGEDNSGSVAYNINYGSGSTSTTSTSGIQKSLIINGLTPETTYSFSVEAKDATGNTAANNPIILPATTLESFNTACSGTDNEASQGAFTLGYNYKFSTSGSDVTVEFELLDNKDGILAYAWTYNPNFAEVGMTLVSGKKFTKTFTGQTPNSTFKVACKFSFAGGMAVTKIFEYTIGDNCLITPTITDFSVPSKIIGEVPFTLTAPNSNSNGAFTYSSSDENVATISGDQVTIIGIGTTTITATQAAFGGYDSGSISTQFEVMPIPPSCGITMSSVSSPIFTQFVNGATDYEYRISVGSTTHEIARSVHYFYLTAALSNWNYNETYTISYRHKKNDVWSSWSTPCTITTPAMPATKLKEAHCNQTLGHPVTVVFADIVLGATGYEFEISLDEEVVATISKPSQYFNFANDFSSWNYGKEYSVKVRAFRNGQVSEGDACVITTPAFPVTGLSQCDELEGTQVLLSQSLAITTVTGADKYIIRLYEQVGEESVLVGTTERNAPHFRLSMIYGAALNKNYSVGITVVRHGEQGEEGRHCPISTHPTEEGETANMKVAVVPFSAVAYPNPYSDAFKLDVKTSNQEPINIKVYDMIGRLVEQQQAKAGNMETVTIGTQLPSGVYNVVVTQANENQTVRVVKR